MGWYRGCRAATIAPFASRNAEVTERLRQAPPVVEGRVTTRWTLRHIRAAFSWLHEYSLSGVWRLMQRLKVGWRWARPARFSPDPAYVEKQAHLLDCLQAAACQPDRIVLVFIDEMGFFRWPQGGHDWMPTT